MSKKKPSGAKPLKMTASKPPEKTADGASGGAAHDGCCGELFTAMKSGKSYLAGQTFGMKPISYVEVGELAMFEGDIVLGTVAEMESIRASVENLDPDPSVMSSVIIPGSQFRWPDGVIVFRIDPGLPNTARVTGAIAHIEANTNLRFRPRASEANFVTFRPAGGCSSSVGMRGGEQFVNLGAGCTLGNTIHEVCHAAGLWHEQSREDRDNFVTINFPNITPAAVHNFDQQITDGDDVGRYDYDSIMHYPRDAFAVNPAIDTITPKPNPAQAIGQRLGLSAGDVAAINFLYPRKAVLPETSTNGPALATRAGRVLMGWTGTGNLRLNFHSSSNGLVYASKVTLADVSPAAPALAVFNNRFFVAWIGVGNHRLNVMSSADGVSWSGKVTLNETSLSTPALAVLGNRLVLAWRGVGNNQLNVLSSTNGTAFTGKVTLADTTTAGPALATLGANLLLAWRGVGNNQLNVFRSANAAAFAGKVTLADTTTSTPGLFSTGARAFLTWQGVGNKFLNVLASTDGAAWTSKQTSKETCIDGPRASSLGNRLVWAWTGTDTQHRLNSMLFSVA